LTIDSVIDTTKQSCLPETVKYMYTQIDIAFVYTYHAQINSSVSTLWAKKVDYEAQTERDYQKGHQLFCPFN